ncbi:MAG: hypothetical protein NVSMB52_08700 [Chloroflexota bacterium]
MLILLARVVLFGTFSLSGATKLADRQGSRQAMIGFGVPTSLASAFGILLPIVELAVAVALLANPTAWLGALGALVLLVGFAGGIVYNLARGRTPDCHCFGQLHSEPIGWRTLARNGVLAVVALFLLLQGQSKAGDLSQLSTLSPTQWLGIAGALCFAGLVALGVWAFQQLLRQNGRLLVRIEAMEAQLAGDGYESLPAPTPVAGLPLGTQAPAFSLPDLEGKTLTLADLRRDDKPVLLVFGDPNCGACTTLLPDIAQLQRENADKLTLALISRGAVGANRDKIAEHGQMRVLLQKDTEVMDEYEAPGTPAAVIVTAEGTIASHLALGFDEVKTLLGAAVRPGFEPLPMAAPRNGNSPQPYEPPGLPIGEIAPPVALPSLQGSTVELADFRGKETLLLFWNTGCGFCSRMLPDLKLWEANRSPGEPELIVASSGPESDIRAMGLQSTVLLDPSGSTGSAYGAHGTPMGVLIDAEGRIASEVAAGAHAVMELARRVPVPQ